MQDTALLLPVLRDEADAVCNGVHGGADLRRLSVYQNFAALNGPGPANELRRLGPAAAHKTRKAQDLTPVQGEGDVLHAVAGEVAGLQHHLAQLVVPLRIALVELAANHQLDQLLKTGFVGIPLQLGLGLCRISP